MKYNCNNIFMIRNPSLPIKTYLELEEQDRLIDSIYDFMVRNNLMDFLKDAIHISSPSLHSRLDTVGINWKKDYSVYMSVVKYLIRASTRPTPYGVLSNVALGRFSDIDNYNLYLDNQWKYDVRVDKYWICKVIYDLENNNDIISRLNLKWNRICYVSGNRLKNPYFTNHGCHSHMGTTIKKTNIRFTPLIKLIMDNSQNFISFQNIKLLVLNEYPNVPDDVITNTLKLLVENEFLFTDLRFPAYCKNELRHVIGVCQVSCRNFL